jgi:nucleoside-diphosphate-sugar epimerase
MNILITGHKGFIGRHFYHYYDGHNVLGIDIKDGNDCRDFFKKDNKKFDIVIHCAAIVGGRMTIEGSPLSVATDLSIDSEMFSWAMRTNQKNIVYFSSSAAYPIKLQETKYKLKENDIDLNAIHNPDMTYGWAKLTGEYQAEFAKKAGLKVYVFRPFSGYGEDQDLDYPFPSFIKRGKEKQNPFTVWGDGEAVRDFIHVDDIVGAVVFAIDQEYLKPVNLGNGRPTSFNELANMVMKQSGYIAPIDHIIDNPVGVSYRCSDNSEMLKFYKPKISLEEGVRRAFQKTV